MGKNIEVKKIKNKKYIELLGVLVTIIIIIIMAGTAYSYAYNYRFTHKSDEIDMYNNSITYYYRDNEKRVNLQKTYTISDNWLSKMLIHKEEIETIGTNTTIYGPYTWLPAGKYKVTFDFTEEGGSAFEYWDVCVNFGNDVMDKQKWSSIGDVTITGTGASVQSPHYWRDSRNMPHLEYYVNTTGDAADYELRLYFTNNQGYDLPTGGSDNMDAKKAFLQSVKIEAVEANTIYAFDSETDAISNANVKELTKTYWGQMRSNVSVPTKAGYTFMGWYGYRYAVNNGSDRKTLKFGTDQDKEKIKLWNSDGTPAIDTEVSYYDYSVWAEWKQNNLEFNANEGDLKYPGDNINNPNGNRTNVVHPTWLESSYCYMNGDIPTRKGYIFNGWFRYHDDGNWWEKIYDADGIAVKEDTSCFWYWNGNYAWHSTDYVTLYANWLPDYNLKVDGDEGVYKVTGKDMEGNDIIIENGKQYSYHYSQSAPTYIYLKEGYEIDYIVETSNNNKYWDDTTYNSSLGRYENSWVMNDDRTIYIHTKPISYKITYNLDGGSVSTDNRTTYTTKDEFTLINPIKQGYVFSGWSGTELSGGANTTVTIRKGSLGDRNYTAHWIEEVAPQPVLKTSSQKGISTTNYESGEYIETGTVVTVKAEVKKGYKFKCWADADGNVVSTDVEYTFTMPDEDVSLLAYAKQKNADIIITKASSTMYNDTLIKRVEGDDKWYDEVGKYGIDVLKEYTYDKCVQVWQINSDREIKRIK